MADLPSFGSDAHRADVAEHAPVLLHSADVHGCIRWANAAWKRALGYDESDFARGLRVRDILSLESQRDADTTQRRILAGERVVIEGVFRAKDGRLVVVVLESAPRNEADGTFVWSRSVLRDVTAERGMQLLARQAERRHRVTLDALLDGVAVLSAEGVVQYVNAAAARLLGVTADQVIGRPLLQLPWKMFSLDGEPRPRESHPALVALRERRAVEDDRLLVLRGEAMKSAAIGTAPTPGRLWLEAQAMLLDPADPESPVISSFRDVSADVQAKRLQEELLGIVAHELRAPLTSLRGALAMLAQAPGAVDAAGPGAALLPMALRNVERLEQLVTDLLDLERIEAGQLPMTLDEVRVQALLDDVAEVHGLVAARGGLTLACVASPLSVRGDAARLHQVLRNLVGNALKFSPPGSTVTVDAEAHAPDAVLLRVTDQGRGIPEDQRERIFERFAQVKREDSTRKGGAGLGLSIVRAIVEAHGGRIHIEDAPGGGSRFVVRLSAANG